VLVFYALLQFFDLALQCFIFLGLPLQELDHKNGFFLYSFGSEDIEVRSFIFGILESLSLYPTDIDERREYIVDLPEAKVHMFGEFSLRGGRVLLENVQHLQRMFLVPVIGGSVHKVNILRNISGKVNNKNILFIYL
jgi:hypothetical protein